MKLAIAMAGVTAGLLMGSVGSASAACVFGNSAVSPCVQTYGGNPPMPTTGRDRVLEPRDLRTGKHPGKGPVTVGRERIFRPSQNPNALFLRTQRVGGGSVFYRGRDADGNLVLGTCVGGICR